MPLIGFCFLVKDKVDFLPLWDAFFAAAAPREAKCYVHAKTSQPKFVPEQAWVDPDPLPTAWGDRSLVMATRRLFETAWLDGCSSFVLLSGDMLPLQPFSVIQNCCRRTVFSLQPKDGLTPRQAVANQQRFAQIAPWFDLNVEGLRKQNMFFALASKDYEALRHYDPSDFPLEQLADEYFWVNALICSGVPISNVRFVFCNPDLTRTQALPFRLEVSSHLLDQCRDYCFIRKIVDVSPGADIWLRQMYAS